MKTLFQGLPWYDGLLYTAMIMMAASTPIHWRLGLLSLLLLIVAAITKNVATRHLGNPALDKWSTTALAFMLLYWLIYAISALRSENSTLAWSIVSLMLPFVAFPLIFMLCDLQFLNDKRIRFLFFSLTTILIVRFIIQFILYLVKTSDGICLEALAHMNFDYIHHNYLSLYNLTAIAFLYTEVTRQRSHRIFQLPIWTLILAILILSAYILFSASRSGMMIWLVVAAMCICHISFVKRNWIGSIASALIVTMFIVCSYQMEPGLYNRFLHTLNEMHEGRIGDIRQEMFPCAIEVAKQKPITGHGCGDYWEPLYQSYLNHGVNKAFKARYSSHNQYLETWMATGYIGLTIQLFMMLAPLILAFKKRKGQLITTLFIVIIGGCIYFESTFGRQMGLLFFCWWNCVLILYTQTKRFSNTAKPQLQKSFKHSYRQDKTDA